MQENLINGKVVSGQKLGRKIGFPTFNIKYDGELRGVFVAELLYKEKTFVAAVNIGGRPTVGDDEVFLEAHLLDFDSFLSENGIFDQENGSSLVDEKISFILLKKIRSVQKFGSLDELKMQINKDVEFARNWYTQREIN